MIGLKCCGWQPWKNEDYKTNEVIISYFKQKYNNNVHKQSLRLYQERELMFVKLPVQARVICISVLIGLDNGVWILCMNALCDRLENIDSMTFLW